MSKAAICNKTRYERVIDILDNATEGKEAHPQGETPFWKLPYKEFIGYRLDGLPLINLDTPKSTKSCCCKSEDADGEEGRGASSLLIKGLRGQKPFDGTQYPPLPWNGNQVSDIDILFISDWIDDDCPQTDRSAEFPAYIKLEKTEFKEVILTKKETVEVESVGVESAGERSQVFKAYSGSTNDFPFARNELKQRMNLDCLSPDQLEKFRYAMRELYKLNKWPRDRRNYNNIALIHQNHCQHGWERFLPWHRVYAYEMEQALQDVCPDVTMPYWDWTMDQYRPEKPECGWIIPESYKMFLTSESIIFLKNKLDLENSQVTKLKTMVGQLYAQQSKFFAEVANLIGKEYAIGSNRDRFIDALLETNPLWYPLRYPAQYAGGGTINDTIHYHYPSKKDMDQIMSLRTFRNFGGGSLYNDSFGFLDQNPHNTMHIWTGGQNPDYQDPSAVVGENRNAYAKVAGRQFHSRSDLYSQAAVGDMFSNLTAGYDPIFWPIHINVDRMWAEWQEEHPYGGPAELDSVLTPWSYTVADTLDYRQFGYEYVKQSYIIPVGMEAPTSRFVSEPIDLPEVLRNHFGSAEIRLHRVPQLPRSCFIRVFLNETDANEKTKLDGDKYAGYLSIFGHGECYGGPGHCAIPPAQSRHFDLRPRNHNTPRNHRIDVTECAKALIDKGATKLQITLVVIGADYKEDKNLLQLEGVSLNFLD